MKIREASTFDVTHIADIHTTSWRNTYKGALTSQYLTDVAPDERLEVWKERLNNPKPNQHIAIAETMSETVGFVCVYLGENPDWGSYLDNLHVRYAYQSKGIGKSLLIEASRWCYQQEPLKGMCLLVNQDNYKAQEFYKKLGARNAQKGIWNAPDGNTVPTYWFVWDSLVNLIDNG